MLGLGSATLWLKNSWKTVPKAERTGHDDNSYLKKSSNGNSETMNGKDLLNVLMLNLKRDEGFRSKPYQDTVGKWTIGYGRNLDDVGISQEEAEQMLLNDIDTAVREVRTKWPWSERLHWKAKLGLYNMAFNLGIVRLAGFKNMILSLQFGEYKDAARHALDSKWAAQVGPRATRIAKLFEEAAE